MSNKFGYFRLKKKVPKILKDRGHGRIIKTFVKDGLRGPREHQLHATRGWRSYRSQ